MPRYSSLLKLLLVTIYPALVASNAELITKKVPIPDDKVADGDNVRGCRKLAKNGACSSERPYMLEHCNGTCKDDIFSDENKRKDCDDIANAGQCLTNPHNAWRECPQSCRNLEGIRRLSTVRIDDKQTETFYAHSTKQHNGSTIEFRECEDLICVVVNVANMPDTKQTEMFYAELERLQKSFSYTVKIIVFPFDVSEKEKCDKRESDVVRIAADTTLNGPETHPVYRYLKELFGMDDLVTIWPTFFVISNTGDVVSAHEGGDPSHIKVHLKAQSELGFE